MWVVIGVLVAADATELGLPVPRYGMPLFEVDGKPTFDGKFALIDLSIDGVARKICSFIPPLFMTFPFGASRRSSALRLLLRIGPLTAGRIMVGA